MYSTTFGVKELNHVLIQVGARALAALQQGVDPTGMSNQQQFLVYPTVGGIPMIISTDPAQQALTKVNRLYLLARGLKHGPVAINYEGVDMVRLSLTEL